MIAKIGTMKVPVVVKGNEEASITMMGRICLSDAQSPLLYVLKRISDQIGETLNPCVSRAQVT